MSTTTICRYALRPCHFGVGCRSAGCLYAHPVDTTSAQFDEADYGDYEDYYAADSSTSAAETTVEGAGAAAPLLTLTERLELFFSSLSAKALSSLPSTPSSEAAEAGVEVGAVDEQKAEIESKLAAQLMKIPAMLARYEGREEDLFIALSAKHGEAVPGSQRPDDSAVAAATSLVSAVSLHDGVTLAYNNNNTNANSLSPQPPPSSAQPAPPAWPVPPPLPAPRAPPAPLPPDAVPQAWPKAKKLGGNSSNSGGGAGWKTAAATAPTFVPGGSAAGAASSYRMGAVATDGTSAAADGDDNSAAAALARVSFVPIPQHLWTVDVARDPAAFTQVLPGVVIIPLEFALILNLFLVFCLLCVKLHSCAFLASY